MTKKFHPASEMEEKICTAGLRRVKRVDEGRGGGGKVASWFGIESMWVDCIEGLYCLGF